MCLMQSVALHGQDFGGIPSNLLDNIVDRAVASHAPPSTPAKIFGLDGGTGNGNGASPPPTGWSSSFIIGYGFLDQKSKLIDGAETTQNGVLPEFIFTQNDIGFAIDLQFQYQQLSKRDVLANSTDSDIHVFKLVPTQDLNKICGWTEKSDKLTAALGLQYGWTDSSILAKSKYSTTDADTYSLSPTLAYTHVFTERLALAITPLYTAQWKDTSVTSGSGSSSNTRAGQVGLPVQITAKFGTGFSFAFSGALKGDVSQKTAPGQKPNEQVWGEFGANLRYDTKKVGYKIGYVYTAGRSDYYSNQLAVSAQLNF